MPEYATASDRYRLSGKILLASQGSSYGHGYVGADCAANSTNPLITCAGDRPQRRLEREQLVHPRSRMPGLFLRLGRELQRVALLTRRFSRSRRLGLGHIPREYADHANPTLV